MSVAFASARPRGKGEVTQQTIQKVKQHALYRWGGRDSVRAPAAEEGGRLRASRETRAWPGLQRWTAGERWGKEEEEEVEQSKGVQIAAERAREGVRNATRWHVGCCWWEKD